MADIMSFLVGTCCLFQEQWAEAAITGMGGSWATANTEIQDNEPQVGKIEPLERFTVLHKMHLSLFNSKKALPVRFMPLELELTLAPTTDWLNTSSTYSQVYDISNIQLLFDELILDESVTNSLYKSLLSNHVISIPVLQAFQFQQNITAGSTSIDVMSIRAFSKLDSIWITFRNSATGKSSSFIQPGTPPNGLGLVPALDDKTPFWCPSVRCSIGGKNWPDPAPATTIPELYYMVSKALGYSPNLTRDKYVNDSFVVAFDLKRVPGDHGTGINTRSGDQVRISIQNLQANKVDEVHVTFFAYGVVALRESGVSLLS